MARPAKTKKLDSATADYVIANPPFNDSDWGRKDDDVCWQYGVSPKGNANFAWVQHFIHHLAPGGAGTAGGMVGFVLSNGSMSSNQSGECPAQSAISTPEAKLHGLGRQRDICRALIEADLVDCMVTLLGQIFYSAEVSASFQNAA